MNTSASKLIRDKAHFTFLGTTIFWLRNALPLFRPTRTAPLCFFSTFYFLKIRIASHNLMFLLFRWACKGLLFGTCENYWLLFIYFLLILLCSCICLQISQMNLTFREIIHHYMKQPQCKPQIFRSVFIDWTSARRNGVCCSTCYSLRVSFCST